MFEAVYDELRRIARRYYRQVPADHTLQPTALVNEAYTKILEQRNVEPGNRAQFLGVAATVMWRKLLDYERRKRALRAGGGVIHVEIDENLGFGSSPNVDLYALDEALERLRQLNERQARVVELRYICGYTIEESAEVLGVSPATVKTDWLIAQAFLFDQLRSKETAA
jgi:RNA polymerase sigma-70 factor (ECF subfamily)